MPAAIGAEYQSTPPRRGADGRFQPGSVSATVDDFWAYVEKSDDPDGCWLWIGPTFHTGYGRVYGDPETQLATRIALKLAGRPLPPEQQACHRCDIRYAPGDPTYKRCVREDHLFGGTIAENQADKVAKGRQARGDTHGFRLHPERIARGDRRPGWIPEERRQAIRAATGSLQGVASRFGVAKRTVARIRAERTPE